MKQNGQKLVICGNGRVACLLSTRHALAQQRHACVLRLTARESARAVRNNVPPGIGRSNTVTVQHQRGSNMQVKQCSYDTRGKMKSIGAMRLPLPVISHQPRLHRPIGKRGASLGGTSTACPQAAAAAAAAARPPGRRPPPPAAPLRRPLVRPRPPRARCGVGRRCRQGRGPSQGPTPACPGASRGAARCPPHPGAGARPCQGPAVRRGRSNGPVSRGANGPMGSAGPQRRLHMVPRDLSATGCAGGAGAECRASEAAELSRAAAHLQLQGRARGVDRRRRIIWQIHQDVLHLLVTCVVTR